VQSATAIYNFTDEETLGKKTIVGVIPDQDVHSDAEAMQCWQDRFLHCFRTLFLNNNKPNEISIAGLCRKQASSM